MVPWAERAGGRLRRWRGSVGYACSTRPPRGHARLLVNSAGVNMSGHRTGRDDLESFRGPSLTTFAGRFLTCREFVRRLGDGKGRCQHILDPTIAPRVGAWYMPPRVGWRS